jgi:hypothetical protein
MRQPRARLVKKLLMVCLLLAGYVVADGGGQAAGACPFIWNCNQCQDEYDYTLWSCRNSCSFGDYECWYTYCEAQASGAYNTCMNCCVW